MQPDEKRTASVFKALCDENRIRILKLLQSGEKCACVLLDVMLFLVKIANKTRNWFPINK